MTEKARSLVILKYDGRDTAEQALVGLERLEDQGHVELADAVLVRKTPRGKIKLDRTRHASAREGAAIGGGLGLLIGAAVGGRAVVAALGAVAGGAGVRLKNSGISAETLHALEDRLSTEQSALALLIESADWESLRPRIGDYGEQVLVAEFSPEDEAALASVLADDQAAAGVTDAVSGPSGGYNVLVLTCDQHNAHLPSPPGYELPNHDRLEAQGLVFDDFQVSTGLCTPSRSVLWTGQHAPLTGMWDNTNMAWIADMDPAKRTVGHMLRNEGYYTAFKGKWHLSEIPGTGTEDALESYGFSDFQGFGEVWGEALDGYKRDGDIAADAEAWLTKRAPGIAESQPWFLAVNFCNPHDIMYFDADPTGEIRTDSLFPLTPEPDDELYAKRWDTTLPSSFDDPLTGHPTAARTYMHTNEIAFGDMPHDRHDMWHNYINYYLNCLRDVDRHIGTVLDALEQSGQADNTIIIFTSDHGDMLAAHGMRQKGTVPFKETWNVPFVVVHPEYGTRRTTQALGSSVDIVPTILEMAGVSEQERRVLYPQLIGEDLSSLLAAPQASGPRGSSDTPGKGCLMTYDTLSQIDFEFVADMAAVTIDLGDAAEEDAPQEQPGKLQRARDLLGAVQRADFSQRNVLRGIYDGRYKFVRFFAINEHNRPESAEDLYRDNDVALYDLVDDPDEMVNLADRGNPKYDEARVTSMNGKLDALITEELGPDPNLVDKPLATFAVAGMKSRRK